MNPSRQPRLASALLATTFSLLAAIALAPAGVDYVKWDQPPDPTDPVNIYYGWNEESTWWYMGPTAADDWVCSSNDPVTTIRWWGSFKDWNSPELPPDMPSHFHILFWTDVPADPEDPNSFSHPGDAIHEILCYNFETTFVGWDYDPKTRSMEACFLFEQQLTPEEYFYQEPDIDQIYWLSISACWDAIEPPITWGWKTLPRDLQSAAPDDAVSITDPVMPMLASVYRAGKPLEFPEGASWDLAFELISALDEKWSQRPVVYTDGTFFNGWNEMSIHGGEQIAGDDWVCSTMDPVTDVHWWGSFIGWSEEDPPQLPFAFHFAIWTDVSDPDPNDPITYSHPGTVVWEHYCYDYDWEFAGWDIDPRNAADPPEACFYFWQDLPEDVWFEQPEPENIYWITIAAIYPDPNDCACEGDVNNDGVYSLADLAMVLSCVGLPPTGNCAPADVDCNGEIDQGDVDAVLCQINAGWPDPNCCPSRGPEYPFGMKTRPRDRYSLAPDDAVRIRYPTAPTIGDTWQLGEPLFWPTVYESWDLCFQLTSKRIGLGPKWTQPPYPDGEGFDAPSNLWWPAQENVKWELLPDPNLPGIHTDNAIHNADDWLCTGGEMRGSGIAQFRLYVHADAGGVPAPTVLWSATVPFNVAGEMYTGLVNLEGSPIYRYDYYLDEPFDQEQNNTYWLHIAVDSNDIADPAVWRWQEFDRTNPPVLSAAVQNYGVGWLPICWADQDCTDFAFIVTSEDGYGETPVNVVVADDFYSDGRDILALQWWGSYFDDRYEPGEFTSEPYTLDGWFVTFHWADVNQLPQFPPDIRFDAHPTALAIYFAPQDAVVITDTGMIDCNGHKVYEYFVRLDQCCLVCTHTDPRNNYTCPPGLDDCFQEIADYRYWLSIQAVTGVEWLPAVCNLALTGHLPPLDASLDGTFWGWHNGFEPTNPPGPLDPAAVGMILDFSPYPPGCWDYGEWMPQPWLCDALPPSRVDMAFELLASDCPEDLDGNRVVSLSDLQLLLSAYGSCCGGTNYLPAADFNNDGCISLADLQILLSAYGSICPTR